MVLAPCGDDNIAELWASKLKYLLNSNSSCSGDLSLTVHCKISSTSLSELPVSDLDVFEALQRPKGGKKDTDNLSSDQLHHAAPVIAGNKIGDAVAFWTLSGSRCQLWA